MEKEINKRCPVCRTNGYVAKPLDVGTCRSCKRTLGDDYELLFQCAESVAQLYGYSLNDVFDNTRKAEAVSARRLITTAVITLSTATSEDVAKMMRLRGRNITSTSLRHAILVARDLYSVSKNYRMLVDKFMMDTLNQYMLSENRNKSANENHIDIIGNVLFEERVCDRERATELAIRISAALNNQGNKNESTTDGNDSSPALTEQQGTGS